MPDRNGLSLWAERNDIFHLTTTMQIFERALVVSSSPGDGFSPPPSPTPTSPHAEAAWKKELEKRHIGTVEQLASECRIELKNKITATTQVDDDESQAAVSLLSFLWKNPQTLQRLSAFLPSPLGFRCFQLAKQAVQRVDTGLAKASYVHRGGTRGEKWLIDENGCWTLDVDCAGFVRNVIQSVTGSDLKVSLSDRDFMRAKDYYAYFERLEYSVTDIANTNGVDDNGNGNGIGNNDNDQQVLQWCRVDDLRSILAGDIIVYRAKGNSAGGSVFTKKDTLQTALTAVKAAELYDIKDEETPDNIPVDINVAKLPEVKEWVVDVMNILKAVGIEEIDQLRGDNGGANDEDNDDNLQAAINLLEKEEKLSEDTVSLLQEVLSSTNGNTGHIMFAAGPAEETSDETHIWRVPVFHSTGVGKKSKRGVQKAYKRFEYSPKYQKWTRGGPRDDVEGGHIEVVVGRMCVAGHSVSRVVVDPTGAKL